MKKSQDLIEKPRKGRTQIHNVRFYNMSSRSITAMACNYIWKKIALARCDGSIEIWDIQYAPCLERIITNIPDNNEIETLVWCGERLFSAGLSGVLIEWNLHTLSTRFKQFVTGNAIYCLDINREGIELAVGTEEGYINIFDITDNELNYKRLFDKQEGRVLCCRFDATGKFLVTGSVGVIRIWDTQTGHAVHRIQVAKVNKFRTTETIIWSLQVLSDFTIIAGDSRGYVTMWNGFTAASIEIHQVLKADVLTIAVNEEEDKLFCAGIEPTIRIYAKTQIKREDILFNRWVKFLQRRIHDHDVKALVCTNNQIYSGGVDGYLGVSSALRISKSPTIKYGPFLQPPFVTVSPSERLLLLRYPNYLEIWRLGVSNNDQTENCKINTTLEPHQTKYLPLKQEPEKLLEFRSKHDESIVCAALSPDGTWLCYSTAREIRLFRFMCGIFKGKHKRASQLIRVKDVPEQFSPASHVTFTTDSTRLILVNSHTKQIVIFAFLHHLNNSHEDLDGSSSPPLDFVECVDTNKHLKAWIKLFMVSQCGQYLVAASIDHSIAVWSVHSGKHYKHLLNLPRYSAATTAMALHAKQPRLVVAYANGKIIEYDLEEMCFTCSAIDNYLPSSEHYTINNICLDARNPNIFIMQSEVNMFVLEKYTDQQKVEDALKENSSKKASLKRVKNITNEVSKVAGLRLGLHKAMEHLLHISWLNSQELVAVNINPITLLEQLPPALREKKFGAM